MCNSLQQKQSRTGLKFKLSAAFTAVLLSAGLFLSHTNVSAETSKPAAATVQTTAAKTAEEINQTALLVIHGDFGNGAERVQKLTEAKFDAQAVQDRVNEIYAQNGWAGASAAAEQTAQKVESSKKAAPAPAAPAAPAPAAPAPAAPAAGGDIVSYAANKMAASTGVSADQWTYIIMAESGGNPNAVNSSSGAYGLFQLLGHGEYPGMSLEEQISMAIGVYQSQGLRAWVVTW
ncbi:hypothetical protein OfM1_03840 [Lactovum odontotermitis]